MIAGFSRALGSGLAAEQLRAAPPSPLTPHSAAQPSFPSWPCKILSVVAGAMQVLSDNIAAAFRAEMEAMYEKLIGDLSEMFTVTVDLSSVSQSTATQLLQSLGFQITVLPLAAAIQVTRSWCKVHSLGWFFVVQRLAHGC